MTTTLPDTSSTQKEIAQARQEMGRTLFLIGDRIAPKKVIARVKEKARVMVTAKVAELKERYNPLEIARRKVRGSPKVIDVRARDSAGARSGQRPALPR
jgi:hypothetical protein